MPSRFRVFLALAFLGLSGCAGPDPSANLAGKQDLVPQLEVGMTSAAIREKLGDPVETNPLPSPEGHAEVWVYYFEKSLGLEQVQTGTRDGPAFTMALPGPAMVSTPEPVYSLAERKIIVTLQLLIFNGRLVAQKAKAETRIQFD